VDILVKIAPDIYKSYITTDKKGTKQWLVQCQNALYGTIVASLLYYRKFTKSLTSVRFKINPYDPCIRKENLLQMVLWKMVHFALFLVKISINFSPSYSTVFFHHSVHLYFTKISKFYYKNFQIFVQCFNK
jgi:hypothetical protein